MRPFAIVLAFLGIHILAARADEFTKTRQVLLPDGSPAAGVPVLVRESITGSNPWADHWLRTDEKGMVRVEKFGSNISMGGFVMVDAPNCALSFWTQSFQDRNPLQLKPDAPLRGKVIDKSGKPVAGAKVFVRRGDSNSTIFWELNQAGQKWKLPQLATQTGRYGAFVLRSVASDEGYDWRLNIVTQMLREGHTWSAETSVNVAAATPLPINDVNLVIEPPLIIRGQIQSAATKKPLAGTTVQLRMQHNWAEAPAPIVTGKDGNFAFETSPLANSWEINAEKKQFTVMKAKLLKSAISHQAPHQKLSISLSLRPQTKLQGRVLDAETNRPPILSPIVVAFPLHVASRQGPFTIIEQESAASTRPDGSFEMLLGVGRHRLAAHTSLFLRYGCSVSHAPSFAYEQQGAQELTIGQSGRKNVRVALHKVPGVVLRLDSPPTNQRVYNRSPRSLEWRLAGGKSTNMSSSSLFFLPTPKWGEIIEVRLLQSNKEILPWTRLLADGKKWPISLRVPESPTDSTASIGQLNNKGVTARHTSIHAPLPISEDTLALFAPR